MVELAAVLADLSAECAALDELVAGLPEADWRRPTPAPGWTIAHQIAHLAWTDDMALQAAGDPDTFATTLQAVLADLDTSVDRAAGEIAAHPPSEVLGGWRAGRQALAAALRAVPEGHRLIWFGPPMSATSMATARLMETWAHGQDVVDTLGVGRPATDRLRHVAYLGVRTRDYAYLMHGEQPPAEPFRVELTGPSGEVWTWGPDGAAQRVTGAALDFCLLVTQRRHRADLDVAADGPDADHWLDIAQAFAGRSGAGRTPGQFAR